jgi:glycine dehydrogenase subunit 1
MLKEVGVSDVMELYADIPDHLRFKGKMNLPEPILDEYSIKKHVSDILNRNRNCSENLSFLGSGCAQHFVPAVCDEINGRGEFLTAYSSFYFSDHGKWQAWFEFQSLMGELLDMDQLSVPNYDGAQAASTAMRMATRITGRKKILYPRSMNPDVLMVVRNYNAGVSEPIVVFEEVRTDAASGLIDLADLKSKLDGETAAVFVENPSYLGLLESNAAEIGKLAKDAGAEYIVYADPISLGVVAPPAHYGATIACGDIHDLGVHLQFGGGQGGFIATHFDEAHWMEYKDFVVTLAGTSTPGEWGFGMVYPLNLSYAAREEGKEYTGTQVGLWAITAAVYMSLMGPRGMQEVGQSIMQKSQYAAKKLSALNGVALGFGAPFFKEFVVNFDKTGKSVREINQALLADKIFGGKDISGEFPELGQSALYCVTEIMDRQDIDRLADAIGKAVA